MPYHTTGFQSEIFRPRMQRKAFNFQRAGRPCLPGTKRRIQAQIRYNAELRMYREAVQFFKIIHKNRVKNFFHKIKKKC